MYKKLAKVGDKVICIRQDIAGFLYQGHEYIVIDVIVPDSYSDDYRYVLEGVGGSWNVEGFKIIESEPTPKYIKCVNCSGTKNLTLGKVYEILDEVDDRWLIVSDNGIKGEWYKERFEPYNPPSHIVTNKTNKTNSSTLDHEEERVRSLFLAVSPGNCACNIPRHQCDYHKPR
jgi:hypothetical protein